MPELVHSHLNFPDEPDEDDGQDSPADDAVPRKFVPNELERAADASEGPPPPPADQTATASDAPPPPPPAPMSEDEQDDESVPEVPGTTI